MFMPKATWSSGRAPKRSATASRAASWASSESRLAAKAPPWLEPPRVRKELGQIPLVTPTSQIVGIQTVNNVLFDDENERYKMITAQVKDLCYGLYGKTAVPINPEVQKKALKGYDRGEEPITCRPAPTTCRS